MFSSHFPAFLYSTSKIEEVQFEDLKLLSKKWIFVPEFVIYKIHLCANDMHESFRINHYLHPLDLLNQLIKFPFFIYMQFKGNVI